jgi:hypothetical protein
MLPQAEKRLSEQPRNSPQLRLDDKVAQFNLQSTIYNLQLFDIDAA